MRIACHGVNERIKKQLNSYPVLLYMKGTPDFPQCGFSARTVQALRAVNAQFAYVNIFEDPEIREGSRRTRIGRRSRSSYQRRAIGGCDIALELHQSGELAKLVAEASPTAGRGGLGRLNGLRHSRFLIDRSQSIHDSAEGSVRYLGVVERRVRPFLVPRQSGRDQARPSTV